MKIIVAVVVYDRLSNIAEWIRCWKMCDKQGAQLIIIHNYRNQGDQDKCRQMCSDAGITYVPRINIGMDIGAFQDVCRGRLNRFPNEWSYLLWATDDVLPMSKKFISHYMIGIKRAGVGVACLEISREVKTHIRTTGFLISQETASKIQFPASVVTSKQECYDFEHKGSNAFYEQIKKMGKITLQIHPDLRKSYLWDTHIRANLKRWHEHYHEFPKINE
jgi:hypothetical protein